MGRKLPIRIVRSAADQITAASAWWEANRSKAPGAFREEIERALELLSAQSQVGAKAGSVKLAGVRRIHLTRIRCHLYYRVRQSRDIVESNGPGPHVGKRGGNCSL